MTSLKKKKVADTICFLLGLRPKRGIEYGMLAELVFQDVRYDFHSLTRREVLDQLRALKAQHIITGKLQKSSTLRLAKHLIGKEIDYE